jgi:excisionase family DNA binding protein
MNSKILPEFIEPTALSELLGISLSSVYRLVERRRVPFYKIGGSLRFAKDDVLKYLEDSRNSTLQELRDLRKRGSTF